VPPEGTGSVVRLTRADAAAVAAIDVEARAGDFLPSLGEGFLTSLYGQLLAPGERGGAAGAPRSWGHGVRSPGGEILGFVVGCTDTEAVFQALSPVRNRAMFVATARALLGRPASLIRMAESLLYTSRESALGVTAELVVIGVRRDARSGGLGARMVRALAAELEERGVARYRVTVKEKNEAALRFYARHGFERVSRFRLYGEDWQVLVADTSRPPPPAPEPRS
jgi:ribosomal protein S18 acetylase RimI-like enzyme